MFGGPRLHAHHVLLIEVQFRRVLDHDDALAVGNHFGQRAQKRGLAGARAARDQDVLPRTDRDREEIQHLRGQRADREQVGAPQPLASETADGNRRSVDRGRRQRRVHAAAVRQPEIGHRRPGVDPAADARGDALDDPHDVVGIAEAHIRAFEPAEPLDVHLVRSVDEHVTDGGVREQRRQRAHADRFVRQLLGQPYPLGLVERDVFRADRACRELLHGGGHVGVVAVEQASLADLVEQALVQRRLDRQVVGPTGLAGLHARGRISSR